MKLNWTGYYIYYQIQQTPKTRNTYISITRIIYTQIMWNLKITSDKHEKSLPSRDVTKLPR